MPPTTTVRARDDAPTPGDAPKPASGVITAPTRPLRFVPAPGWPDPEPGWVLTMQGWEPPVGWVPAPGLPAAPTDHVAWRPDPDRFPVEEQPFLTQGGNRVVAGAAALAVALVLLVGQAIGRIQLPVWVDGVVVPALVALGVVSVVIGLTERHRAARVAWAAVAQAAAERRAGRPAVAYLVGAPPFGAIADDACGPDVAAVPKRVRRRSRAGRRGIGRTWGIVALALGVAAAAFAAPDVVLLPSGADGALLAFRQPAAHDGAGAAPARAVAEGTRSVRIGRAVDAGGTHDDVCLRACWAWRLRAVSTCPSAVAHVEFGTGLDTRRPHVARAVDRRLGALAAGSVTTVLEDRTAGQQARMTAIRCDGAPGPLMNAAVRDVDDDTMWAWTIAPRGSCAAATLTVERDEPADDGTTRIVRVEPLTAGVPLALGLPRPPGAVTARVLPITC